MARISKSAKSARLGKSAGLGRLSMVDGSRERLAMVDGYSESFNIRIIAVVMIVVMLAVTLLSSFYIAFETGHHCHGEECPICECVQQCVNTLTNISGGDIMLVSIILPLIVALFSVSITMVENASETLVTKKVRMDN